MLGVTAVLERARALYINTLGYLHLKREPWSLEGWVPFGGYFRSLGRPAPGVLGQENHLKPHKQHG